MSPAAGASASLPPPHSAQSDPACKHKGSLLILGHPQGVKGLGPRIMESSMSCRNLLFLNWKKELGGLLRNVIGLTQGERKRGTGLGRGTSWAVMQSQGAQLILRDF